MLYRRGDRALIPATRPMSTTPEPIPTNDETDEQPAGMCRKPSCHSRLQVREILTKSGSVTLCRPCRKLYMGVSA